MPSATLSYSAVTSVPSVDTYRVVYSITSMSEFPDTKAFVLRASDDKFDHVADVEDYTVWPGVKTANIEMYRAAAVTVDYSDPSTATRNIEDVVADLTTLVETWAQYRASFDPDVTGTITEAF